MLFLFFSLFKVLGPQNSLIHFLSPYVSAACRGFNLLFLLFFSFLLSIFFAAINRIKIELSCICSILYSFFIIKDLLMLHEDNKTREY